jgi:hypothetical protein
MKIPIENSRAKPSIKAINSHTSHKVSLLFGLSSTFKYHLSLIKIIVETNSILSQTIMKADTTIMLIFSTFMILLRHS